MARNKSLIDTYVKQYVADVFEKRLRGEGFVCPDDKLLCWYRVRNHELVDSVIFNSQWSSLPIFLDLAYGIHPLFIKPVYTRSVLTSNNLIDPVCYHRQRLVEAEGQTLSNYSDNIPVLVPMHAGRGIYTLDSIVLPEMEQVQTVEDCYYLHKERIFGIRQLENRIQAVDIAFHDLPHTFIDLAIYVDDREVYPHLQKVVKWNVEKYMWKNIYDPQNKKDAEEYTHWLQIDTALFHSNRENYLKILEGRNEENVGYLKKKFGLDVR